MANKILVADDDWDNRTILTETLLAHGFEVVQAVNGLEVLEIVEKEKPNLIILDLSMPKMDGWQVVAKLKSATPTRDLPVIAFTAHAMEGDEQKAKQAGCDYYFTKPCAPKKILEKIEGWLGKK